MGQLEIMGSVPLIGSRTVETGGSIPLIGEIVILFVAIYILVPCTDFIRAGLIPSTTILYSLILPSVP